MKLKLPLIAAFVAVLGLTACGGSGGGSTAGVTADSPLTLTKNDTVVGTGTVATAGSTATVSYTGWLYSSGAAEFKGIQFDKGSFAYTVGSNGVIAGFDQGVTGMKVGGKRVVLIPGSLAYGAAGKGTLIPPNAGLVFEIELTAVN
jgi:FKBP-type peptidyl-prolyl cis-trans isomerase FkpA